MASSGPSETMTSNGDNRTNGQTNGHTNGMSKSKLDWTVYQNVVDGGLMKTKGTRHGINPATGNANPEVPVSTKDDVDKAMIAAKNASVKWGGVAFADRAKALVTYADALEAEHQAFSEMLVQEQGKPVWLKTAPRISVERC